MPETGSALSFNPNLCAACAAIVDETEDAAAPPLTASPPDPQLPVEAPEPMRKAA